MRNSKPIWISESEAAQLMGYHPRYLREIVKNGKLEIAYTAPTGRKYHYNKVDIEKVQLASSNYMQ